MKIEASDVPSAALIEYARIPIVFEVNAVLDVGDRLESGGFTLTERRVQTPYLKDYDAIAETPAEWARRFDTSKWGLMIARIDDHCVGGVTVAYDTPGLDMLEGRSDLAVIWDIRVASARRQQGVGTSLFKAAEAWAVARGCQAAESRDAEHQPRRMPVLRTARLRAPGCSPWRVPGMPG